MTAIIDRPLIVWPADHQEDFVPINIPSVGRPPADQQITDDELSDLHAAIVAEIGGAVDAADPVIDRIGTRLEPGVTVLQMRWLLPLIAAGIRQEQAARLGHEFEPDRMGGAATCVHCGGLEVVQPRPDGVVPPCPARTTTDAQVPSGS